MLLVKYNENSCGKGICLEIDPDTIEHDIDSPVALRKDLWGFRALVIGHRTPSNEFDLPEPWIGRFGHQDVRVFVR